MRLQMKAVEVRAAALLLVIVLFGFTVAIRMVASGAGAQAKAAASAPTAAKAPSDLDVVNVHVEHTFFHPMDNVVLQVERMNGRMVGKPGQIISLDDTNSFSIQVDQAVTRLSARDLSALINSYLLQRADSAVRRVDVTFDGQQVVLKGQVHKLLTLPFEGRGVLSTTSDGELRMHMDEFRVAGMLNRGFLAFFGIRLDDVAQPRRKASFRRGR